MNEETFSDALDPMDAQALDALIDAGFQLDRVEPSLRDRAAVALDLFSVLDTPPPGSTDQRRARIDKALAGLRSAPADTAPELTTESNDALEAFVMGGGAMRGGSGVTRDRLERLEAMSNAVTGLSPDGEAWVEQTRSGRISVVLEAVRSRGDHEPIQLAPRRSSFRMADLISVASLILIGSAVVMPILGMLQSNQRLELCAANLGATSQAFGLYANAYRDELPMAHAGFGGSWMRVGEDPKQSNSANLFTLARSGYASLEALACPGNERAPRRLEDPEMRDWQSLEEVSYSYQILPGSSRPVDMLPSGAVVLTDRSPVILRVARKEPIFPEANSPNHDGEGQHVLRLDGSWTWEDEPVLEGGDNLWLPRSIELVIHEARSRVGLVDGDEMPDSPEDAFVGP
ncbi:MAG: hypothetical protein CMJ31_03180 [Phycisphaerae bacterium]|nr:hypothetical protein [Phycisphaerae bacterium]